MTVGWPAVYDNSFGSFFSHISFSMNFFSTHRTHQDLFRSMHRLRIILGRRHLGQLHLGRRQQDLKPRVPGSIHHSTRKEEDMEVLLNKCRCLLMFKPKSFHRAKPSMSMLDRHHHPKGTVTQLYSIISTPNAPNTLCTNKYPVGFLSHPVNSIYLLFLHKVADNLAMYKALIQEEVPTHTGNLLMDTKVDRRWLPL